MFLDAPLFGAGIGGFAGAGEYPHNLVAEVAAELGFVGVLLLLLWFGLALRGAARSPVLVALVVSTERWRVGGTDPVDSEIELGVGLGPGNADLCGQGGRSSKCANG